MSKIFSAATNNNIGNDLLQQHELLQSMAIEGPAVSAIVNAVNMKIVFVNRLFEYYLGYTNSDIENKDVFFSDLIEDYMRDRLTFQLNIVKDDLAARARYVMYSIKDKKGVSSMFYLYASPIHDAGINNMYYLLMHPDLSKWNMPFTSFNTRELFLEQFNSENFGTFEWLIDADKVFWSVGVFHIYEVDDKNCEINRFFTERFNHPDDKERVKKAIDTSLETGADINIEARIITAKNKIKIIHSLAKLIKNKDGKNLKLVGSIRDVTGQRHIEENLKSKVDALNQSNQELEEFAYVASHDMQEPLRKITTYSDRLADKYKDVLTGDGLMYLSRMVASAENMRSLINDLLDFSRVSKTRQLHENVDMNLILQQVKNDLELTIEETKTEIHSHSLPVTEAIPSQMKQLFTNIIGNAIKFHKPGEPPAITIEASVLTEKERLQFELQNNRIYNRISISDNGIGFEGEYNTRIFQVFQRLHGKAEYPGSGIGLAICKKIVEYHHGIIYAEGVPGTGARFVFILPQHQEPTKAKQL